MGKTSIQGTKGNKKKALTHFSFKWKSGNPDFLLILMVSPAKLQMRLPPVPIPMVLQEEGWRMVHTHTLTR